MPCGLSRSHTKQPRVCGSSRGGCARDMASASCPASTTTGLCACCCCSAMIWTDNLPVMRTAFILHGDGKVSRETSDQAIVAALHDPKAIFWLDLFQPDDADLKLLADVFHFHPLAIEDSVEYTQRPKIEQYQHVHEGPDVPTTNTTTSTNGAAPGNGYFYMVFHGPDLETFRQN